VPVPVVLVVSFILSLTNRAIEGFPFYAMRIIALLESAVGNWIVKSPELDDLSEPKSRTHTPLLDCVEL